ncbi:MAG: CDP-alcohol phosphatidyltransferase family protein [Actinomycetota bacterium]|nr:CDP-alcohol phosphatidyltransferase family protein [Actinomycetota bacterium]
MSPGAGRVEDRWLFRLWRAFDYLLWLPLGTQPEAVAELRGLLDGHLEFVEAWEQDPVNNRQMPATRLAWLVIHDAGKDLRFALRLIRRLGSDSRSIYWVFDLFMVFLALPTLFLITGLALGGGPGAFLGGTLFGVLWLVLAQKVRTSAQKRNVTVHPVVQETLWTLPNVITMCRLVALVCFPFLLIVGSHSLRATVFLAAMASTDWADGFVARHYQAESRIGKMLDPVADRLMMLVVVTSMTWAGFVPWPLAGLLLLRETLTILFGVTLFRPKGDRPGVEVCVAGKLGFVALSLSLVLLLAAGSSSSPVLTDVGYAGLVGGLLLTYYALAGYLTAWAKDRSGSSPTPRSAPA